MTVRPQRNEMHGFGMPKPYNPKEGLHANIQTPGIFPYCAMVQIAEDDDYDDYVICRGFDIRINKFIDYESGESNKPGIPVAKPYGKRYTYPYTVGEVFAAVLPYQMPQSVPVPSPSDVDWRVGQNPGVAETTEGHPADLDEAINILYTDEGEVINWFLLDSGGGGNVVPAKTQEGGISERSGTTPGSGTVDVWDAPGSPPVLEDTLEDVTCYNIVEADVNGDTFILMEQDKHGNYWIIVEDCPDPYAEE